MLPLIRVCVYVAAKLTSYITICTGDETKANASMIYCVSNIKGEGEGKRVWKSNTVLGKES